MLGESPYIREEVIHTISLPSFPWEQFVQVGSSHLILPALFVKLQEEKLLPYLPDELVSHLEEIHTLNVERNRSFIQQVHWLVALLNESDIHPIFLKGAGALLDELYSDPGERVISDIDCLVSAKNFNRAVELLKAEGYTHPPFHTASLPMMHHYPSLFKAQEPAQIEIHRYPVGRRQLKYVDLDAMTSQLFQSDISHSPHILKGHDQILINVIHSQLKDKGQYYANIPLRNIYEFYKLSKKHDLSQMEISHPHLRLVINNYIAVASKVFSPAFKFPIKKRLRTKLFVLRFELSKSNRLYFRWSQTSRSLFDLLHTYLHIISRAFVRKDFRKYLRARLSNPAWYRHHLSVLRKRFSR